MDYNQIDDWIQSNFPEVISFRIGDFKNCYQEETLHENGLISCSSYPYATLTSAGIKEEGQNPLFYSNSPEICADHHYPHALHNFLKGRISSGKKFEVIWRTKPRIQHITYYSSVLKADDMVMLSQETHAYWMYSRLTVREVLDAK